MNTPKKFIYEAAFIRPILILLLVIYHAFIIYQGGWNEPEGFEPNRVYWWISKLSYSFMLETFVFISGYIFALQLPKFAKNTGGWKYLVINKLKRLLIPSVVFSIIYVLIFHTYTSPIKTIYTILNGAGHMWFLPMLFWCFILLYYLLKLPLTKFQRLGILLIMALVSYLPLPFRMGSAMYYVLFFYFGYMLYESREKIKEKITGQKVVLNWIVYAVLFVVFTVIRETLRGHISDNPIYIKAIIVSLSTICQIIYAVAGVWAIYTTALYYTSKHQLSDRIIQIGGYCMGVYIFQQFILQIIYYKTSLPILLGNIYLPWVATFITLILSLTGTLLLKKTPFVRDLI